MVLPPFEKYNTDMCALEGTWRASLDNNWLLESIPLQGETYFINFDRQIPLGVNERVWVRYDHPWAVHKIDINFV